MQTMKIDSKIITVSNNDIEANLKIRKLLIEHNIPHSLGASSIRNTRKVGRNTTISIESFTLYKFKYEGDAVEFKLRYL